MKKRWYKIVALLLVVCFVHSQAGTNHLMAQSLEEIQQQKEENQKKQNELQKEKDNAQNVVDGLQQEADELGSTYYSLNSRLQTVNDEIDDTQNAIVTTQQDIEDLEQELADAKEAQQAQYEGMKKRIQYMYENGTDSLLVSILESGSIVEFIQRTEYVAMITSYDRQMVDAYGELQETITAKSEELSTKKMQLSAYRDTLATKQDELDDLVENASDAYSAKNGEVSAAQMSVEEFDAQIAAYREQEKALEQKYAEAQIEIAKQIAQEQEQSGETTPEDTSGALSGYTEADLKLMAAIIQAEAGGESYAGKLAVGTVVMNRVMSSKFPNTLSGVIYQTNQFQPVRDGHLALILERGPNETCINAAREVLNGYRSGDWLFFMTQKWADHYGITGYTMIGNHAFFVKWGAN